MEPTGRETPPSGGNRATDRLAEDHPIRTGHNSHSRADRNDSHSKAGHDSHSRADRNDSHSRTGHDSHSRVDPTRDTNPGSSHGNPGDARSRAGGETTALARA